jgi:hypothetical protein
VLHVLHLTVPQGAVKAMVLAERTVAINSRFSIGYPICNCPMDKKHVILLRFVLKTAVKLFIEKEKISV